MADTRASTKGNARDTSAVAFTDGERAAMKDRAKEVKRSRGKTTPAEDAAEVLAKIAELDGADRAVAERLHEVITANVPELAPKTWYGMPAYAKDGKIVCFFQSAAKFKTRYATFGFNEAAQLDEGDLWPVAYALTNLTDEVEERIIALVKRAVS